MSVRAKRKQQKQVRQQQCQEQCIEHIPYYLSGLWRARFFRQLFSKQLYTNRFREHQGKCVVAVIRFCLGIQRKITTALEFIAILVSDDCKNDVTKRVIIGCNDLRNATRACINLTETFQQCCNEAEECVLPKHFYNVSCREHIIASCAKNGSQINFTTLALSQI